MKMPLKSKIRYLLYLGYACLASNAFADYFYNPIQNGADPWCTHANGYYYYLQTDGGLNLRRAQYLVNPAFGLPNMGYVNVFTPPAPNNQNIWAPQLHYINGNWYIYYTAGTSNDPNDTSHRMFCLEADTQDPLGTYTLMGKVYDSNADFWAIDGTVMQLNDGSLYFIYCSRANSYNDGVSRIYIAPMSNPWTISGPRVLISSPTYSWEANVNEAPEVLVNGGNIFIIYSANSSGTDNYCLGKLTYNGGSVLSASSWVKASVPQFSTYVGSDGAVYAPGHCSFTKSYDGTQDWIVYHAAVSKGSGFNRNVRAQQFGWNSDGSPNFGHPIPTGDQITVPSGEQPNNSAPVSVVVGTNGANYLYAIGTDGALWSSWQTSFGGSWLPWTSLGGLSTGSPFSHVHVVTETNGQQVAFAQENPGGAVWTAWQTSIASNLWSGWFSLGGSVQTFEPVLTPNGGVALYALGMDGSLWTSWQTNYGSVWAPWTYMGGSGFTRLHMIMEPGGATTAFCLDSSGNVQTLWQTQYGGVWNGFANLGGDLTTFEPVLMPAGNLALYGVARNGGAVVTLWQNQYGGTWNGWASLGANWVDNVHVISQTNGATAVFASWGPGTSVSVTWQTNYGGLWNSWVGLGGAITDFKPAVYPNGTMSLFGMTPDSLLTLWQTVPGSAQWFGWSSLGGTLKSQ